MTKENADAELKIALPEMALIVKKVEAIEVGAFYFHNTI